MQAERPFWVVNETRVGHFEEGQGGFDWEQPIAPIRRSKQLNLCNGFRIWGRPPSEELIDQIIEETGFAMVDFWIGTSLHKHWMEELGMGEEEFHDHFVEMMKSATAKHGDKLFWTITGEPDSQAPNWPVEKFESKKAAYEAWMQWLKDFAPAGDTDTKLRWHSYLTEKGVDLGKCNVAIHLGFPMPAHYAYELGVRMVWFENNAWLVTGVQPTAAFARGAANQYRANRTYWGLDFSTWNDPSGRATSYDKDGRRLGGCTESLLFREWAYTYLAGADLLHQEISDRTHWIWDPKPYAKLSRTGKMAAKLGKFIKSVDRGKAYHPVAVMLEHDHGWLSSRDDAGNSQVWFGTLPAGKADLTINHFFDLAFPGHGRALSGYGELYAEKPWSKMSEYREMVLSGKDMRPYEKGRLAASRWGDVIDVVLEDCPEDVLNDYKVIVLQGGLKVGGDLAKKLLRFAERGGTVVGNVTHYFECPEDLLENMVTHGTQGRPYSIPSMREGAVDPEIEQMLGFKFTAEKTVGSASCCEVCSKVLIEDGMTLEQIELLDSKPVASVVRYLYVADPNAPIVREPLAVERKVGNGRIITTLAYFMMQPVYRTPLGITAHILDHAINPTLPFIIDGPAIQYLFNEVEGGWLVSLFNNTEKKWRGEVVASHEPGAASYQRGPSGEIPCKLEDGKWHLDVSVPKFDFRVLKVEHRQPPDKAGERKQHA